jgi:hypothetical protein
MAEEEVAVAVGSSSPQPIKVIDHATVLQQRPAPQHPVLHFVEVDEEIDTWEAGRESGRRVDWTKRARNLAVYCRDRQTCIGRGRHTRLQLRRDGQRRLNWVGGGRREFRGDIGA